MPPTTIVSDEVISDLLAAGPTILGQPEVTETALEVFGSFDPAPELLRSAIDAVFWASLSAEEGKPSLTRVQFNDVRDPQCRLAPCPISAMALRRLSPLMDEPSNVMYVRKDANIVGVGSPQRGISVVAHRPGHLAVLDGPMVLGVFDEGNWVIVGGGEVDFSHILGRALPPEEFRDRLLKATLMVRLAMVARRTGRGAAFILIPADRKSGISTISYPVESFPALQQALSAWQQAQRATPSPWERQQNNHLVGNAIAVVAAGAGIDGATVIDDSSLRLLGFGGKISAPDDEREVGLIEVPSFDLRRAKKKELGGMRHQTAARLVQYNHDAAVITVSQDGTISLFAWVKANETVVAIKHLDRYLAAKARFER